MQSMTIAFANVYHASNIVGIVISSHCVWQFLEEMSNSFRTVSPSDAGQSS